VFVFGKLYITGQSQSRYQSRYRLPMPPKRKDDSAASASSGPKTKRSKPSFRTPTTTGPTTTGPEAINPIKNRVVTLRSSASGRRGYRSQDLATPSNSNPSSPAADLLDLPPHMSDECNSISHSIEETDLPPESGSTTKSRPKQKNTTTVRPQLHYTR
jgi:hypothetical protein